jgi:hypothetical protein
LRYFFQIFLFLKYRNLLTVICYQLSNFPILTEKTYTCENDDRVFSSVKYLAFYPSLVRPIVYLTILWLLYVRNILLIKLFYSANFNYTLLYQYFLNCCL